MSRVGRRSITSSNHEMAKQLIKEAVDNGAREFKACEELGISLRTLQRWRSDSSPNRINVHMLKDQNL